MHNKLDQFTNEIISIFMMLMLFLALMSGPDRGSDEELASPLPVSVTKASKVATEPLRRPADGGRRLFEFIELLN